MAWSAYVDESEPDARFGVGAYVLAAALLQDSDQAAAREVLLRLRLRGQRKLHWHDESDRRRKLLTETIAALPALHLIVIKIDEQAGPERRRRLCLGRLLPELVAAGVREVYLESREPRQNARDRAMLDALRRQRQISSELRMYHQPGPQNPLLWIPDVVAGAVGAARRGEVSYLNRFAPVATIVEL